MCVCVPVFVMRVSNLFTFCQVQKTPAAQQQLVGAGTVSFKLRVKRGVCVCVQVSFSKFERSSKIGVCVMVSSVAFEHGATGRARRRLAPVPVRVLRGGEMLAISCAARKDFHSVEQ